MKRLLLVSLIALLSSIGVAQERAEWRAWNQPVEPFRIIGNVYYVGANEIASYLITSPQGHILLDGGFAETAPQIRANVEKLGFKMSDVKYLLNTQAHSDHAGGFAELKRLTHAKLLVAKADAGLVERGGHDDFAFGNSMTFPAAKVDGFVQDGETIRVGDAQMTAHITPGHTKGCTTWTTQAIEGGRSYDVTFLCSTTAPGYKLVNNAAYPTIVSDFRSSFAKLRKIHTDVFLASHGSFFHLEQKRKEIGAGKANPFIAPDEYQQFLAASERDFEKQLREQQANKLQ